MPEEWNFGKSEFEFVPTRQRAISYAILTSPGAATVSPPCVTQQDDAKRPKILPSPKALPVRMLSCYFWENWQKAMCF